MIGTIGAYTSMMKMQYQWNNKKDTGAYTQKSDGSENPLLSQLDNLKEQNTKGSRMTAIINKMNNGKKLTTEELEYLQSEDPAAYQKAKEIQMEQEGYEKALKRCKTKEEVQRLKSTHMGVTMATVNSIANNPNIPEGKKMGLLMQENAKVSAVCRAEREFIQSGQYDRLPDEAEQKEEMEREQEETEEKVSDTDEGETKEPGRTGPGAGSPEPGRTEPEAGNPEPGRTGSEAENPVPGRTGSEAGNPVPDIGAETRGNGDSMDRKQSSDNKTAKEDYRQMETRGREAYRRMAMDVPERENSRTVRKKV